MDMLVFFGESNLHVKKILGGSSHIFPILTNSSDLSHNRPWKILGMVFDGCINRSSRLGSLTFAVYPDTKKSPIHLGSDPTTYGHSAGPE